MRLEWLTSLLLLAIPIDGAAKAQGYLRGQASAWVGVDEQTADEGRLGLRYIPELSWKRPLREDLVLDAEASASLTAAGRLGERVNLFEDRQAKAYRLWLRCSGDRFEVRLGLQKLNFGPATLLRPLMWFDSIDPRDPLRLTDGVYGLLGRYYFMNNANLWVWGLYGNSDRRGWDVLPPDDRAIEFGGRYQRPVGPGEVAAGYHRRKVDASALGHGAEGFSEHRFALDGRWDVGIGLWGEGVVVRRNASAGVPRYRQLLTVGADYTFAVGTGLHVLAEHMLLTEGDEFLTAEDDSHYTAVSLGINLGMLDRLSGILTYDWEREDVHGFLSWGRTYDDWNLYLNGFWNPRTKTGPPGRAEIGRGRGLQAMVVYNHGTGI
jgi:hypothetical protein